jgi:hypothetical protein
MTRQARSFRKLFQQTKCLHLVIRDSCFLTTDHRQQTTDH